MVFLVYFSFSLSLFTRCKTTAHKARTQTSKRKTRTHTKKSKAQWPPPTLRSCKLNLCSSCFLFCWTLAVSACRLYRSLAASSLASCSCRSLSFTLSNCHGPRFLGIGVTGSAKGKKWKNTGSAGEGERRRRGGQKGRFSKMWGGGEVL